MNSTQGVLEACFALLYQIEGTAETKGLCINGKPLEDFMPAGALYVLEFTSCINDYIKRPGMIDTLLTTRRKFFKALTPASIRKYAALDVDGFAQVLYDLITSKGKALVPAADEKSPDFLERCLYAAYVYTQTADFLDRQNATFALVPLNKGMSALALINKGIQEIDEDTKKAKISVGDVTFEIAEGYKGKVSTAAIMLCDFFLQESHRTGSASIAVPVRDLATLKQRSTSKQALQKLSDEVLEQMEELKPLGYRCRERIGGKWKHAGRIDINGGTALVVKGVIYWNFNQDLYKQFSLYAPTDYPRELWSVDPRTNQFYFGRFIAQNRRLNEGKPGRNRIPIKTLISKTPNLPTYDEVMKGNRDIKGRIIKKTFADLDALETLYYDVYTADGKRIDNPEDMDYQTFISAYIEIDYSDYPQHTKRVEQRQRRQKKLKEAKEKREIEAALKAAEREDAEKKG